MSSEVIAGAACCCKEDEEDETCFYLAIACGSYPNVYVTCTSAEANNLPDDAPITFLGGYDQAECAPRCYSIPGNAEPVTSVPSGFSVVSIGQQYQTCAACTDGGTCCLPNCTCLWTTMSQCAALSGKFFGRRRYIQDTDSFECLSCSNFEGTAYPCDDADLMNICCEYAWAGPRDNANCDADEGDENSSYVCYEFSGCVSSIGGCPSGGCGPVVVPDGVDPSNEGDFLPPGSCCLLFPGCSCSDCPDGFIGYGPDGWVGGSDCAFQLTGNEGGDLIFHCAQKGVLDCGNPFED